MQNIAEQYTSMQTEESDTAAGLASKPKDDNGETPVSLAWEQGGDVLELFKGLARHDRERKLREKREL